jgi:hypothetical protein
MACEGADCCAKRAKARVPVAVTQFEVVVTEFSASSRTISITSSVSHKECSLIVWAWGERKNRPPEGQSLTVTVSRRARGCGTWPSPRRCHVQISKPSRHFAGCRWSACISPARDVDYSGAVRWWCWLVFPAWESMYCIVLYSNIRRQASKILFGTLVGWMQFSSLYSLLLEEITHRGKELGSAYFAESWGCQATQRHNARWNRMSSTELVGRYSRCQSRAIYRI